MKRHQHGRGAFNVGHRLITILALLVLLSAGCASQWTLRMEQAGAVLQWPYQPARAKVTYVSALRGFRETNPSRAVVRAVVYGDSGDEGEDSFALPVAVVTGRDGRLAVADMGCGCVHLYIPKEKRYLQVSGLDKGTLKSPVSVAFDQDLRLYVSDSVARKIFVFGIDGSFLFAFSGSGTDPLKRPAGIAYNSRQGLLYVADAAGHKIRAFNTKGEPVFSFGQRGAADGQFNFPTHIFWSPAGELYVTDSLNFRIQIFDESGRFLSSFGHHGDGSGDLAMPKGVAVDEDGVIYVADSLFDNIQLFNRRGEFLLAVGSRGSDFGEFWMPSGVFMDESGKIYVCDTYNRRVQLFQITEHFADEKP